MSFQYSSIKLYRYNKPFYIFKPRVLSKCILNFLNGFSGKVIYSIKTNPSKFLIEKIFKLGVKAFDVSSINEIKIVNKIAPKSEIFFMNPVKSRKSILEAYFKYNVKHFSFDTYEELNKILEQTNYAKDLVLHLRISVPNIYAKLNLEHKFGIRIDEAPKLLKISSSFAEKIGICFHPGSQCLNTEAYKLGIKIANKVIKNSGININYLNVGGGFPVRYPDMRSFSLMDYFTAIRESFSMVKKNKKIILMAEPGRCLVAECMSLVVKVELRKKNILYINDGVHGSLHDAGNQGFIYPVKMINLRNKKIKKFNPFSFYGPTCDSSDFMEGPFCLPNCIDEGDFIEIGQLGAYSSVMRSNFNGFDYSNQKVVIGKKI